MDYAEIKKFMKKTVKKSKIKIVKDGPYIVSGNIPLTEKIITPKGSGYEFKNGRVFTHSEEYSLCRCGKSKNAPFCDNSHKGSGFNGTETASKNSYKERAELIEGLDLDLLDDGRCAFARFCYREDGHVWDLLEKSDDPKLKKEAIIAASECPAGRLVAVEKTGESIEPDHEQAIHIIQDQERGVSSGIFVKGNIPIESSDNEFYEIRNRVMLCRCGKSRNKPFCDARHIPNKFSDK